MNILHAQLKGQRLMALISTLILFASPGALAIATSVPDKITAEEVVAKHLEALGPAEVRSKSRIIQGTAIGTLRLGGSGSAEGGAVMASQDTKSLISVVIGSTDYPYERVGFDGKTVTTGELTPGVRSRLGIFFMRHEMPIREGLLGGTLSSAWPLLNISAKTAKLKYKGTKKVAQRAAHVLEYDSKNNAGLKTTLFFDAETFRHLRTEYEKRQVQLMPDQPSVTQQQGDSVTKLIEEFSDFKDEAGLILPHTYKLTLSIETLNQRTLQDWLFTLAKFSFDQKIDDSQFDVRSSNTRS